MLFLAVQLVIVSSLICHGDIFWGQTHVGVCLDTCCVLTKKDTMLCPFHTFPSFCTDIWQQPCNYWCIWLRVCSVVYHQSALHRQWQAGAVSRRNLYDSRHQCQREAQQSAVVQLWCEWKCCTKYSSGKLDHHRSWQHPHSNSELQLPSARLSRRTFPNWEECFEGNLSRWELHWLLQANISDWFRYFCCQLQSCL